MYFVAVEGISIVWQNNPDYSNQGLGLSDTFLIRKPVLQTGSVDFEEVGI